MKTYDEYCNAQFRFKNKYDCIYIDEITRVHPLKQNLVIEICSHEYLQKHCKEIVIFGSSTSMKCNSTSDLDICIDLKDDTIEQKNMIETIIGKITNWNYDVIYKKDIEKEKINKNIKEGAVVWAS